MRNNAQKLVLFRVPLFGKAWSGHCLIKAIERCKFTSSILSGFLIDFHQTSSARAYLYGEA